jgi:putative endonuclease
VGLTRSGRSADARGRLGLAGEKAAETALRREGITVLERRFRLRSGEIDLIAEQGDLVIFVEVKTRRGTGYGRPAESVTPAKRARIARVALAFLKGRHWLERPCRFDVVEVLVGRAGATEVRHIPDAFRLWPTG